MKNLLKYFVILSVDFLAQKNHFEFPPNFTWYWKLEMLREKYESETTIFFKKHIKEDMVVVDIGANIGYFTRLFSKLVGPNGIVYAFEPDSENWEFLEKNSKNYKNIHIFKNAISDADGEIDFFHVNGMTGTHTTIPVTNAERRKVSAQKLDTFMDLKKIARIDIVKIDVEGAEEAVLRGMSKLLLQKPSPMVVFEYTPETSSGLLERLQNNHSLFSISKYGELQPISKLQFRKGKRQYSNVVIADGG